MDLTPRARSGRWNKTVSLTRTEFSLLECLLRRAGRVVTREYLMESVWGSKSTSDNNLEVYIKFYGNKVDAPGYRKIIHTERGIGYCLKERT